MTQKMKTQTPLNEILHGVIDNKAWAQESLHRWLMEFFSKSANRRRNRIERTTACTAPTIAATACTDFYINLLKNDFHHLRKFLDGDMEHFARYVASSARNCVMNTISRYTFASCDSDVEVVAEEPTVGVDLMDLTSSMVEHLVGKQRVVMESVLDNLEQSRHQSHAEQARACGMTENQFNRTKHAACANLKKMADKEYDQVLARQDMAYQTAW